MDVLRAKALNNFECDQIAYSNNVQIIENREMHKKNINLKKNSNPPEKRKPLLK